MILWKSLFRCAFAIPILDCPERGVILSFVKDCSRQMRQTTFVCFVWKDIGYFQSISRGLCIQRLSFLRFRFAQDLLLLLLTQFLIHLLFLRLNFHRFQSPPVTKVSNTENVYFIYSRAGFSARRAGFDKTASGICRSAPA
jgi:hypothetical protein